MAVKIITDSTSAIDAKTAKELEIKILSLYVTFNGDSIKATDISNEAFFARMEKEGIPVSSQPAVGDMMKAMEAVVSKGDDLICVFLSAEMSGTFESGILAKNILIEKYPEANIEIIDSRSNSMELGFLAIQGSLLARKNKSFDEVVSKIKETIHKTRFIFIPDNLDYLHKGGRIGGAGTLFGNMFKITPILTVRDGNADVYQTVRTKKRAKARLIQQLLEDHKKYTVAEIVVHHINTYDEALSLKAELSKEIDVKITIADIGPVIGLHVGPSSVGLAYRTKAVIKEK